MAYQLYADAVEAQTPTVMVEPSRRLVIAPWMRAGYRGHGEPWVVHDGWWPTPPHVHLEGPPQVSGSYRVIGALRVSPVPTVVVD